MSIFVDFHILQTVPPSCVNQDDTGSPKTAVYGGYVRARISSQAWKYAMRIMFKDYFAEEELGSRTKFVVDMALKENPFVDIALFGRMATSEQTLNCDVAAQVADAISTHTVQNEYDYFTDVDNIKPEDNAGAGHLGTVEFNSSTLYRYATVNITELAGYLGKEAVPDAVQKFADAFICSMPTGKHNSFANRTFPDMVYVTVRSDQPVNLCGAFENPVKENDDGYSSVSEKRLAEYAETVYSRFSSAPDASFGIGNKDGIGKITNTMSLDILLSKLEKNISERMDMISKTNTRSVLL